LALKTGEPNCSMSVFNGLLAIRHFLTHHANVPIAQIVVALKRNSPNEAYHDYERALALHELIPPGLDCSKPSLFFREVLSVLIFQERPWWLRFAALGRQKLLGVLTDNERQCFEAAGLLEQPAGTDIVEWWDLVAGYVRNDQGAARLLSGREGEQLTIDYETARLESLGIDRRPQWIALEDNTAGYDVHSYDKGPVGPVAKLIEVKATRSDPPEIFVTRNEWETALDREPNYFFYIWLIPSRRLVILKPQALLEHIPQNHGSGVWEISRIVLPNSLVNASTTISFEIP
jgi:uncharacterized protein DUF3883